MKKIFLLIILIILGAIAVFAFRGSQKEIPKEIPKPTEEKSQEKPIEKPADIVSIQPKTILPGDPIMITVDATSSLSSITFDGKKVSPVLYDGKERGFVPIDFYETKLNHTVNVTLSNGMAVSKAIKLTPREKIEKPLGIPEKLGGNTPAAAQSIVSNLSKENAILASAKSNPNPLWIDAFKFPLPTATVTDDYGYDRDTVGQTIVHKGTDFHAVEGTPVMAMNKGIVRIAQTFVVYGNAIVVDHGGGILSMYMHLSKINVKVGDEIEEGQVIGESGMTGYAEAPHLHVSVRINGISIDPMTFMSFFKQSI